MKVSLDDYVKHLQKLQPFAGFDNKNATIPRMITAIHVKLGQL